MKAVWHIYFHDKYGNEFYRIVRNIPDEKDAIHWAKHEDWMAGGRNIEFIRAELVNCDEYNRY